MLKWQNPWDINHQGLLNFLGEIEHYNMSKRVLGRYSPQFSAPYSALLYPIQSTVVPRTAHSANSFGYGLFEGTGKIGKTEYQPFVTVSNSANEDLVLRFFSNCPLYTQSVLNNISATNDCNLYLAQYSTQILNKVVQKLGLQTRIWRLTFNDVMTFYEVCSFEASVFNDVSHFCSLFDMDDAQIFETFNDLSDYWIKGYGNAINYQISCPLLVDFWTSVTAVIKGGTIEKARLRFAHAETILPFVSLLGLFSDPFVLHWDNPNLSSRNWRSSQISPFASNVALGLYNCNGSYKVKLLHNEVEVPVPGCGGTMYCPVNQFQNIYAQALNCSFNALCGINKYD